MVLSLDFLGFGSKSKWAFRVLDREWAAFGIDIRRVDGGVRQILYQWAHEFGDSKDEIDHCLLDLAAWSGFLMLGPEIAVRPFGTDGTSKMKKRLNAVVNAVTDPEAEESLDAKVIKLLLAAKLADSGIEALVTLDRLTGCDSG